MNSRVISRWLVPVLLVVGSLTVSRGIVRAPGRVAALVVGAAGIAAVVFVARRPARLFLAMLGCLLIGYAFFGWRFATLGAPPVFVGEVVLSVGLAAAIRLRRPSDILTSALVRLLAVFIFWGLLRTLPFVPQYGADALRDGVVWGYGVFALLVAACLRQTNLISAVPAQYKRWYPAFLLWAPAALVLVRFATDDDSPLFRAMKAGDAATHLGGVAAFILLGLHRWSGSQSGSRWSRTEWALWAAWLLGVLMVASTTRGGLLAIMGPLFLVFLARPVSVSQRLSLAAAGFLFIFLVSAALDLSGEFADSRSISADQVVANFLSIFTGGPEDLEGTRRWRLLWWNHIIAYTFNGEYFWGGKGFGINLATSDGFQVLSDDGLRSPHNIHMTILGRAGVPGLAIWAILQITFATLMSRAFLAARRANATRWAHLNLWILTYWLALLINATFDVFLEGPQGGIWFWSVFGLGIAALDAQRGQVPTARAVRPGRRSDEGIAGAQPVPVGGRRGPGLHG